MVRIVRNAVHTAQLTLTEHIGQNFARPSNNIIGSDPATRPSILRLLLAFQPLMSYDPPASPPPHCRVLSFPREKRACEEVYLHFQLTSKAEKPCYFCRRRIVTACILRAVFFPSLFVFSGRLCVWKSNRLSELNRLHARPRPTRCFNYLPPSPTVFVSILNAERCCRLM